MIEICKQTGGLLGCDIRSNNCYIRQIKRGINPVWYGVELGLDDKKGKLISCCYDCVTNFIYRISCRGVGRQSLINPLPDAFNK